VAGAGSESEAEVKRLAAEGKTLEAVQLAGAWVAEAQKRGDLIEEGAAFAALRGIPLTGVTYCDACAELIKLLDSKRNGAYVSAHFLALEIVRMAIRNNDDLRLADALVVLTKPRKEGGACATVLEDLLRGVVAARKGETNDARLRAAFEAALMYGWLNLATYAGTELACAEKKAGRESDTLDRLDEALRASGDRALLQLRRALAEARIPERSIELGPGGVSAKGGRGGRGGVKESPVGEAWEDFPKSKALITVKRGAKEFEIEPRFRGAPKGKQEPGPGVRHWDGGGITLSFYGKGVALTMIDLTGRRGQPGESSEPQSWQISFYPLAPGETWSLTREGTVAIKK